MCGEAGHNARTCIINHPSKYTVVKVQPYRCRSCGGSGHNARSCPARRSAQAAAGGLPAPRSVDTSLDEAAAVARGVGSRRAVEGVLVDLRTSSGGAGAGPGLVEAGAGPLGLQLTTAAGGLFDADAPWARSLSPTQKKSAPEPPPQIPSPSPAARGKDTAAEVEGSEGV